MASDTHVAHRPPVYGWAEDGNACCQPHFRIPL